MDRSGRHNRTTKRPWGHAHLRLAMHQALELGDDAAIFVTGAAAGNMRALRDRGLREQFAERYLTRPREGARSADLIRGLILAGKDHLELGNRPAAETCWSEAANLAQRAADRSLVVYAAHSNAHLAYLDGRLNEALSIHQAVEQQAQTIGLPSAPASLQGLLMHYLGVDTSPLVSQLLQIHGRPQQAQAAVFLAWLGRHEEARTILRTFSGLADEDDETGEQILAMLLQVAILVQDTELLRGVMPRLASSAGRLSEGGIAVGISWSFGRLLGETATVLDKSDEARAFFEEGVAVCERVRFRPELALLHLDLAELLFDHYPAERADALEHLDVAITELQQMKMAPALERALRRKLQLQGVDSVSPSTSIDAVAIAVESERPNLQRHAAPDGTVTLLFTDIHDSTGHTVRLGDQRWLEILRAHHALIRQQVHDHGGFEVKSQGDGFMLAFGSARRALDCAVAIQRAVELGNARHPDSPIKVRIGLHTGEALKEADDFHGKHVVLAARIANQAKGGEILVSSLLKELTESSGDLVFDEGREVELKGLAGAYRMYAVNWA